MSDRNTEDKQTLAQHVFDGRPIGARSAVGEVAHQHRRCSGEVAAGHQVGEHSIHAIGAFADVFQEDDRAFRDAQTPGRGSGVKHGEVATNEGTCGGSAAPTNETAKGTLLARLFECVDPPATS